MSPVPAALSPVVTMPQSILKPSVNYQTKMMDLKEEEKEKKDPTWVSFDIQEENDEWEENIAFKP